MLLPLVRLLAWVCACPNRTIPSGSGPNALSDFWRRLVRGTSRIIRSGSGESNALSDFWRWPCAWHQSDNSFSLSEKSDIYPPTCPRNIGLSASSLSDFWRGCVGGTSRIILMDPSPGKKIPQRLTVAGVLLFSWQCQGRSQFSPEISTTFTTAETIDRTSS